jgi:hypothetical protein
VTDRKVALIAVAKNEGPYIAQFIFHHLRMGFDPICILTNDCSDNTVEIVNKISARYPAVVQIDANPLKSGDPKPNFQVAAYTWQISRLRDTLPKDSYIALLDVDEFWLPLNGADTIQDFLSTVGSPDIIMHNWAIPIRHASAFGHSIKQRFPVLTHRLQKSIFKAHLEITRLNPHTVWTDDPHTVLVASGMTIATDENGARLSNTIHFPTDLGAAFVLHDMFRSEVEYFALLVKGVATNNRTFRHNKTGYYNLHPRSHRTDVELASGWLANWGALYEAFARIATSRRTSRMQNARHSTPRNMQSTCWKTIPRACGTRKACFGIAI